MTKSPALRREVLYDFIELTEQGMRAYLHFLQELEISMSRPFLTEVHSVSQAGGAPCARW